MGVRNTWHNNRITNVIPWLGHLGKLHVEYALQGLQKKSVSNFEKQYDVQCICIIFHKDLLKKENMV